MKVKPVEGYDGLYEIDTNGQIKALEKTIISGKCNRTWPAHYMKYGKDKKGYFRVSLSKNGKSKTYKVHRLVAQAFIPNPENKPQVNHIDGNKQNNSVNNLEWCTGSDNMKHACKLGLKRCDGEFNSQHKLSESDVNYIRSVYKPRDKNYSTVALSKRFNVHRKTITRIVNNQYWKGVCNHV